MARNVKQNTINTLTPWQERGRWYRIFAEKNDGGVTITKADEALGNVSGAVSDNETVITIPGQVNNKDFHIVDAVTIPSAGTGDDGTGFSYPEIHQIYGSNNTYNYNLVMNKLPESITADNGIYSVTTPYDSETESLFPAGTVNPIFKDGMLQVDLLFIVVKYQGFTTFLYLDYYVQDNINMMYYFSGTPVTYTNGFQYPNISIAVTISSNDVFIDGKAIKSLSLESGTVTSSAFNVDTITFYYTNATDVS